MLLTIFNVVVYVLVRHWDSLVEEQAEGGSSDDNGHMLQTSERKIWEMDDCRRREEEGHARMTVKAEFLMCMMDWRLQQNQGGFSLHLMC